MKLIPYIQFTGNCEEALNRYKEIFEGEVNIVNRYDNSSFDVPDDFKNKVLHAHYKTGEIELMACDVFPGKSSVPRGSNISLSVTLDTVEKATEIFNSLAKDGKVKFPFEKQFWGAWHGSLTDKFGINWMINCE